MLLFWNVSRRSGSTQPEGRHDRCQTCITLATMSWKVIAMGPKISENQDLRDRLLVHRLVTRWTPGQLEVYLPHIFIASSSCKHTRTATLAAANTFNIVYRFKVEVHAGLGPCATNLFSRPCRTDCRRQGRSPEKGCHGTRDRWSAQFENQTSEGDHTCPCWCTDVVSDTVPSNDHIRVPLLQVAAFFYLMPNPVLRHCHQRA